MRLKSLELQGFKTFPDKTKLAFEEGITSVVGPNGSGKSNISDAMRWVLGEQSVRVLRCSKMEDVVFSGTPQRKAQGYAEVTLNIDNSDRRVDFDNDNIAITRRYYRSGESEYLINKNLVRLKDINELFMDTGLGRDGYSIIGQGKIDSIVAAKSEDRREIFEEASGISRYRYRKEEAERRLNRAEDNLVRLRDILGELEERVGPLKIQAEKAEQFIEFDAEKKDLEIGIWIETLNRSGKILREHTEKIDLISSQYSTASDEINQISEQIEQNLRDSNEAAAKMDFERNEASRFDEQATEINGQISVFMNEISHSERDIERIREQIGTAALSEKDINADIATKREEIKKKEADITASRKELDEYTSKLEELRQNADEATKQIEEAAMSLANINSDLSEERVSLSSAQSTISEIKLRAGAILEAVENNTERVKILIKEEEELAEMLVDTEKSVESKENSLKGYQLKLDSRRNKAEAAKEQADKLMLDANEQARRARILEDLERNLEGFTQSAKTIIKEGERGTLRGIHGPVTKIIKAPSEYALALETALGMGAQNIVVETEADAKAAINYLKTKNAGRGTFLPRTTIKGRSIDKRDIESLPGFVGIASELCESDSKFTGIKDFLLGRVVIAEDLDSAASIAKRSGFKFRIVSLDGQQVNVGGSLTGGSKVRNSGLLSRTSEIEKMKKKSAELKLQAESAAEDYKERQSELSNAEAEIDAVKAELQTALEERIKISSELMRAQHDLDAAKEEAANLNAEKDSSQSRVNELELSQKASETKIKELEEKAVKARENSESLTSNREDHIQRSDEITRTIQEIRFGELTAQKDKDALTQAIVELEARKTDSSSEVEKLEGEIKRLEQVSLDFEAKIKEHELKAKALRTEAENKRKFAEDIGKKRLELEKASTELRLKDKEITSSREDVSRELARLQERSENFQKEYDGIISKLWEEYELTRKEAEEMGVKIDDMQKAQRRLTELKNKIKALGAVNVAAVVEYKEVSERYEFLKTQIEDVEKSKAELIRLIGELTKQMREQFIERFAEINKNFQEIFKELFGGGSAELAFSNEEDVLTSGIDIKVHPPGKIVTHIESLSGGEKALVAISIYFAIMKVSPPPFCVLDEIEAALDDVNVGRFAQYLRRMSDNSQFIVITHRRGTMEGSDMLYGVTMQDQGISKLLALKTQAEADELQGA